MILARLKKYLDENKVPYVTISHAPAYTAEEIAHLVHVPGKDVAKTVMINIHGKTAMAVLPSSDTINFKILSMELKGADVYLEDEDEFRKDFPDCEVGAMPPFGNLYAMDVYVSKRLAEDEQIVFNAGTHQDMVKLRYQDFARLVQPRVLDFSVPRQQNPGHIRHDTAV